MCGIIFAMSHDGLPVNTLVWNQYEKQKHRGREGFGIFNGQFTVKAAMEKRMKRWVKKPNNGTDMLLFHHRFPTSTINTKRAAHPFNTGQYFGDTKYVLVHNGTIDNPDELRKSHTALGINYQSVLHDGSYNDSEALLWDFALTMEGKQKKLQAYGGIAFICIKLVNNVPERMFFGRNSGRPLMLLRDDQGIMLSSEGDGEETIPNRLYNYNYSLNRLSKRFFHLPSFNPNWEEKRWDRRSSTYKSTGGTYGSLGNAASGYTNTNNVCATDDRYYGSDYYVDPYGEEWFGHSASITRQLDEKEWQEEHETDYNETFPYELQNDDGTWETVTANIRHRSDANISHLAKNPMLVGAILNGKEPTKEEVSVRVFQAIGKAAGSYSVAYWHLVGEDEMIREQIKEAGGSSNYKQRSDLKLLAACLSAILDDENNDHDEAKHPLWCDPDVQETATQPLLTEGVL